MKILYFGTICDLKAYDKRLENCKAKPSVAPIVFESAMLEGFRQNDAQVEIHSFPMIPTFPASRQLTFGGQREALPCGYTCRWLKTVNIPVIKQLSRRLDGRKMLKRWLKANAAEGVVFTYSIPPFLVKDVLKYAKRYGAKTVAIIPDLLRDMYINEKPGLLTRLKNRYLAPALALQSRYDGYIYLTEAMAQVVAPDKPYMVMEGIADVSAVTPPCEQDKSTPRGILYAGMLHEKYGIVKLLDAFEALDAADTELWLFGDGTAVPEIRRRGESNPRIRYFGTVTRDEILTWERKATLLVNPRDPREAFTQYSFPSKTIEYMLSGTPLLTTKLQGIPESYFPYVFSAESNEAEALTAAMEAALAHGCGELVDFGANAQKFIVENKNSKSQTAGILEFMEKIMA